MTQKPSIGRIVHYVIATGQRRAAVISGINDDDTIEISVTLSVEDMKFVESEKVVIDGRGYTKIERLEPPVMNAEKVVPDHAVAYYFGGNTLIVQMPKYNDVARGPGTWHWPERLS